MKGLNTSKWKYNYVQAHTDTRTRVHTLTHALFIDAQGWLFGGWMDGWIYTPSVVPSVLFSGSPLLLLLLLLLLLFALCVALDPRGVPLVANEGFLLFPLR